YVRELFDQKTGNAITGQMDLDFSDERQYRFASGRYLAAGTTPENSPTLFEKVEQKRARDLTRRQSGQLEQALDTGAKCDHYIHLTESDVNGTTTYNGRAINTCTNGSPYVYTDLIAYSTNYAETQSYSQLGQNSGEQYGDGKFFDGVLLTVSIPSTSQNSILFDSTVSAEDASGNLVESYIRVKTAKKGGAASLSISNPRELINTNGTSSQIRTCLARGTVSGNLDCDYATVKRNSDGTFTVHPPFTSGATGVAAVDRLASQNAGQWRADASQYWPLSGTTNYLNDNLYLPLQGTFNSNLRNNYGNCTINSYDAVNTTAAVILAEKGGDCKAGKEPDTNIGAMSLQGALPTGSNTAAFSRLMHYGKNCVGEYQNIKLFVQVAARMSCPMDNNTYARYASTFVQPLDLRSSCFAEGTEIKRADGSVVKIQDVKMGDKVLANGKGLALTVTSISRGGEFEKMVRLVDDKGHNVLVTSKHPVVTSKGVKQADMLKSGEQVVTDKGLATLTHVAREAYTGQVWNLGLGTAGELAVAGKQNRTMFANGILAGDSEMQMELTREKPSKPSDVMASLPKEWQRDYKLDLARNPSAVY
ncbi:MAG TPA: Hint domain-containing protein, partial [Archangium sp.]|nr:Hint domain-containing protein [Archangium sp.]